jgi:hypothetical protein
MKDEAETCTVLHDRFVCAGDGSFLGHLVRVESEYRHVSCSDLSRHRADGNSEPCYSDEDYDASGSALSGGPARAAAKEIRAVRMGMRRLCADGLRLASDSGC